MAVMVFLLQILAVRAVVQALIILLMARVLPDKVTTADLVITAIILIRGRVAAEPVRSVETIPAVVVEMVAVVQFPL